jgi:hypothetical protein
MSMKRTMKVLANLLSAAAMLVFAVTVFAEDSTIVVTGNTSAGENQPGWMFARDLANATPYEFSTDQASIGVGSLYVLPIGSTPAAKFIGENFLNVPVAEVNSISYDFRIGGGGDAADANKFYLNVYVNIDNSPNFYDCRFDYVPANGSTAAFTTATLASTAAPTVVARRGTRIPSCPTTLAGMPAGSYVRAFSLNVGDTSANDEGLDGYLDNVVVDLDSGVTIYDFERTNEPDSKDKCKNGSWRTLTDGNVQPFANQGDCIQYFNTGM